MRRTDIRVQLFQARRFFIEFALGDGFFSQQLFSARQFQLGQFRLGAGRGGSAFGARHFGLEWARIDDEQHIALFHFAARLEIDGRDETADSRTDFHALDRFQAAREFLRFRDLFFNDGGGRDGWAAGRWRVGHLAIGRIAAGQAHGHQSCQRERGSQRLQQSGKLLNVFHFISLFYENF
ncbi:hypothetical protein D3C72_1476080 [compost metagenome]